MSAKTMTNLDEYRAVRDGAGISRIGWRGVLELTGRDRVRFLHNLSTNDVLLLATGRPGASFAKGERLDLSRTKAGPGHYNTLANRQGKLVAEFKVRMLEDRIWLDIDRAALPAAMDALGGMIIMDDVTLADRTADFALLRLDGPKARDVLAKAAGPVADLPEFQFSMIEDLLVSPFSLIGMPGYDLQIAASRASDVFERLAAAGSREIGEDVLETLRIEHGFPRWGVDLDSTMLPLESGLEPIAVSFTKGCYLGQEVIQRVKTYSEAPRQMVQLVLETSEIPASKEIRVDHSAAGRVTSVAYSPRWKRAVALGLIRKEHQAPGTRVTIGADVPAEVRALPWHSGARA
ncbi:MAG: aminomethyl transferase family protein [Planctomycetes bacterium]|nr:aminomethyl transferase family protein [Planctomycetota bacterium]